MTIDKNEWEFHVEHKIEKNSECPHIYFKTVNLVQIYFGWHVVFSTQNCSINILDLFGESEIRNLEYILVFAFAVKYILKLDIPMEEAHFVNMLQS